MFKQLLMLSLFVFLASGEAQAKLTVYTAVLSGANEVPANVSTGTGFATIKYNDTLHTLQVGVTFSGLSGNTSNSHIHCCTSVANVGNAGVATQTPTFTLFPSGVKAGTYDHTFDLTLASSWNAAFITAKGGTVASAETAFAAGLATGKAYLNIHSTLYPGGEIRGFLAPVPEPEEWALMLLGFGVVGFQIKRKQRMAAPMAV
jgi:hypothetical protein